MLDIIVMFVISLSTCFLITYEVKRRLKYRYFNLPPSIINYPLIGSIPCLPSFSFTETHKFFLKETKKIGPIIGFHIFSEYNVVLNGKECIIEALSKNGHAFSDRPQFAFTKILNPNQRGIFFHPYDDHFKKYHKTALGVFREFGFGSKVMEERIKEEISFLVAKLKSMLEASGGNEFLWNPSYMLANYSLNIICSILFGKRFNEEEKDLDLIVQNVRKTFSGFKKLFIFNFFPFLIHFPFAYKLLEGSIQVQKEIFDLLEKKIEECSAENAPRSLIGRMVEIEGENLDKEQLLYTLHELFLAGTETSASSLEWSLVLLANNPDVQEKMASEMSNHLDPNEPIGLHMKCFLKYCEATILEIYRMKSVAPFALPRYTSRTTKIMGFDVPANIMVLVNLYSIHMDPDIWDHPEQFKPERFIDEKGDIINSDSIMPFSIGKRSCFGEMLARQEVFLSVCSLVREFRILPPFPLKQIHVNDVIDVTLKPSSFKVAFQIRK